MRKELSLKRKKYLYSVKNIKKLRQLVRKKTKKLLKSIKTDCFELGYVLGVICGDGNLTKYSVRLNCIDRDFAEFFKQQIEKWSKMRCKKQILISKNSRWKNQFFVQLNSKEVVNFLKNFNLKNLVNSSKEMKIGFLKGFFDSEGTIYIIGYTRTIEVCNANLHYLKICKILLEQLGIRTRNLRKGIRAYKLTLQNSQENFKKFKDKIGFSIKRKHQRLTQLINSYCKKRKEWSEKEISFLKQNYRILKNKEIAKILNRTRQSIYMKKIRLNLIEG
jgi:hypothetical protein